MTDPYREFGSKCPTCRVGPMRGFGDRWVCDQCGGMLIGARDLEGQLDLGELTVENVDVGRACPRCEQPMAKVVLRVGKLHYDKGVEQCPSHGLWLDAAKLVEVLDGLGGPRIAGLRYRNRMRGGVMSSGAGGFQMFGHVQAYAPPSGGGGLAIQNWWMRDHPPEHTPFRSAFDGTKLACPCCDGAELHRQDQRWPCARCDGAFVENAALAEMMSEMRNAPWDLPAVDGRGGVRRCPVCSQLMTVQQLEGVEIDRCSPHGIWFDAGELAVALHHTAPAKGWLRWLLR